ncbi:Copper amine oxidase N-terminal domain-containing protein [Paenibacillus sp. yr247]|uniref:copper amine oxidase N-terminal domain-containing protein n=1 Tax=Paenibacillus sp. yr247 TaxID=1761880 RepID=UPI00087EA520|nr:copper amine oxidase N-terminal domain-containing protein [Paenibacillus sp. yr247]SDO82414.1 Copper amine oxidase N-terminal domain-containing protein [Paenibacillus sp. yr247]
MKTWKKVMAVTMVACTLAFPTFVSADDMMMPKFNYSGVETITKDGNELAPLRQIAESLGFKVTWNDENRSVTLTKPKMIDDISMMDDKKTEDKTMKDKNMDMGTVITILIDSKTIKVGGMEDMLMVAPTIVTDKTYVPKEFVDTYLLKEIKMK